MNARLRRWRRLFCVAVAVVTTGVADGSARAAGSGHGAPTLEVYAAASLSDAFTRLGRMLEQKRPGLKVEFNFAGSQQLATQIEQGAVADVFASADDRWMTYAHGRGLLDGESSVFAHNALVVIVPRTNPGRIRNLRDLGRGGLKVVLGADAVPVGHYSRAVLRNLALQPGYGGEFYSGVIHNVVSEEENVKAVVGKVQLGEADAGMVYRSDVTPAVARFVHVIEIPDSANVVAAYPVAVVRACPAPEAARAFIDLVLSQEGQRVLKADGFAPLEAAHP